MDTSQHMEASVNRRAAYQVAVECLPSETIWAHAIEDRCVGMTAKSVFEVVDAVRMVLLSRIAAITSDGDAGRDAPDLDALLTEPQSADVARLAFELVLHHFPSDELLFVALPCRRDGSDIAGVLSALSNWRRELHVLYGDATAAAAYWAGHSALNNVQAG